MAAYHVQQIRHRLNNYHFHFVTLKSGRDTLLGKTESLCSRIYNLVENTFGEGNGTPLQYSCLENPMDGGAWKAAVHRVAEGRT